MEDPRTGSATLHGCLRRVCPLPDTPGLITSRFARSGSCWHTCRKPDCLHRRRSARLTSLGAAARERPLGPSPSRHTTTIRSELYVRYSIESPGRPEVRTAQELRRSTQYHVSPEAKFANGRYFDRGGIERRHVVATSLTLIGKEANRVGDSGQVDPIASAVVEFKR
jgi:hypothetical protein